MGLEGRLYPKQSQHPNIRPSSLQAKQEADARSKATAFKQGVRSPCTRSHSTKLFKKYAPAPTALPQRSPRTSPSQEAPPSSLHHSFHEDQGPYGASTNGLTSNKQGSCTPSERSPLQGLGRQSVQLSLGQFTLSRTARLQPNGRRAKTNLGSAGVHSWRQGGSRVAADMR